MRDFKPKKKRGNYTRTEEHKTDMAATCSANASGSHIEKKKKKHRLSEQGVKERFCIFCNGWFSIEAGVHFRVRICKSKRDIERIAYDCRLERRPTMAYYSAKSRCKLNSYYKGIEVKMPKEAWVQWWTREQERLNLKDPTVDRIDSLGHYTFENMQLLERKDNSSKAIRKNETSSLCLVKTLEEKVAMLEEEIKVLRGR